MKTSLLSFLLLLSLNVFSQVVLWTGSVNNDWNTAGNWTGSAVPTASSNVVISGPSANLSVQVNSVAAVNNLTIQAGGSLSINSNGTLSVAGLITKAFGSTLSAETGAVTYNGTLPQVIAAQTFDGNVVKTLVINNTAGVTLAGSLNIASTGSLRVTAGTLTTGGFLILNSDATGTARILNSAGTISGDVNCQVYISGGRRAFRFLSHPLSSAITLASITDDIDITGQGGAASGFTPTLSNNPSAFWYNVATANGSTSNDAGWTAFTNASGAWNRYQGIRVLVRGEKGQGLDGSAYTPVAATLTMSGPVNQGSQVISVTKGGSSIYAMIGNPFPSPIDMSLLTRGAGIATFYYYWSPSTGTRGAYIARLYSSSFIIPVGAAFITGIGSSSTITVNETAKSIGNPASMLRTSAEKDHIQFELTGADSISWDLLDVYFKKDAINGNDDKDAPKLFNPDISFYTLSADNQPLAIDARPYSYAPILMGLNNAPAGKYTIQVRDYQLENGVTLFLHDKLLNTYTELHSGAAYTFTVSGKANTQGNNRFELVQRKSASVIPAAVLTVKLSPNPAKDRVLVTFDNHQKAATTITLTDGEGKLITTVNAGAVANGQISLNVKGLAKGTYYITLNNSVERTTQLLHVQ